MLSKLFFIFFLGLTGIRSITGFAIACLHQRSVESALVALPALPSGLGSTCDGRLCRLRTSCTSVAALVGRKYSIHEMLPTDTLPTMDCNSGQRSGGSLRQLLPEPEIAFTGFQCNRAIYVLYRFSNFRRSIAFEARYIVAW